MKCHAAQFPTIPKTSHQYDFFEAYKIILDLLYKCSAFSASKSRIKIHNKCTSFDQFLPIFYLVGFVNKAYSYEMSKSNRLSDWTTAGLPSGCL